MVFALKNAKIGYDEDVDASDTTFQHQNMHKNDELFV
jgi:hypothetical protein